MADQINITAPGLQGQDVSFTISGTHNGVPFEKTVAIEEYGIEPEPVSTINLLGGRMNVVDADLVSISAGDVVLRSDGKTSVNLRDVPDAQIINAETVDGETVALQVSQIAQQRGFASPDYAWLALDANGHFKPEPGRRHRKIYVSSSAQAMDQAAIAAHWNQANGTALTASNITGSWLVAHPEYGGSPDLPVTDAVRKVITDALWAASQAPRSDWVLYERGYTYGSMASWDISYMRGESELHPLVIGAWGTGARPDFSRAITWLKTGPRFLLIRDLKMPMIYPRNAYGTIYENCRISGSTESQLTDSGFSTLRECTVTDVAKTAPGSGRTTWDGSSDRISGLYAASALNLMFDGVVVDRNGWAEGYDYNRDGTLPMPPSDRNHGLYLTFNNRNIHLRDSLISRNSSCGLQIRVGGQYERNLFVDNNIACGLHSGTAIGKVNQFTNFIDNVNFGAGYKKVVSYQGAIKNGFDVTGALTAQIGCVVAHLANPDDPDEVAERVSTRPDWDAGSPYSSGTVYIHNDTQVFAWQRDASGSWGPENERIEGLDQAVLMQTTIQRWAAQLLDTPTASINDLVVNLRDGPEYQIGSKVRAGVQWTKTRFGRPLPERSTPADLVFRPDPRTEGIRCDNRLNWTTLDEPGTHVADTMDLDGHDVVWGTMDKSVAALKSRGGALAVSSGKLTLGGLTDAADLTTRKWGQLVLGATSQSVAIKANGGRVVLTGTVSNLGLEARGRTEVLLGADTTIPVGKALVISGQSPRVGWDGTGSATLTIQGTLEFRAGLLLGVTGTYGAQRYVEYGERTGSANFSGVMADYEEVSNTTNKMWFSDVTGLPVVDDTFQFGYATDVGDTVNADVPKMATVASITSRGLPQLQIFRSGTIGDGLTEPTVTVDMPLPATFDLVIGREDLLEPGYTQNLTGPGITVTNPHNVTLPANVTLTGGTLIYAKPV